MGGRADAGVFTDNLPTKWLQNFQITDWKSNEIDFTGGVKTTMDGSNPEIWQNGVLLRDGSDEFLPYDPSTDAKIYAWSGDGKARTWTLPTTWSGQKSVTLYRLTQTGKADPVTLPVNAAHQVTLHLTADTPYVVYPSGAVLKSANPNGTPELNKAGASSVDYGQGGIVSDAEFYSQSWQDWKPSSTTGSASGVSIQTDAKGFQLLQTAGSGEGQASQTLTGLKPGTTYAVGTWVRVVGHRTASIQFSGFGGAAVGNTIDAPTPPQDDGDSRLYGQNYQRLQVLFTPTAGHTTAVLALIGGADTTSGDSVSWTDVHGQADPGADNHPGGVFYAEDFEHVAQGWGPFSPGTAGEQSAMLSKLNPGYIRNTISGEYSLQTIDNGESLQYRTWPGTIDFQTGHAYRVQLDYQTDTAGLYDFQVGADGAAKPIVDVQLSSGTPDNTEAQGQLISVGGSGSLGFLASASGVDQSGTVTLDYTDGTSSTATFGVPNWCCENQSDFNAQVALKTVGNNAPSGNRQNGVEYDVFYNQVALTPGKMLSSVVLPDNPALHIFAVAASQQ